MPSTVELTPFRRELLALIPPALDHLAPEPTTAFVWPTEHCSIGCAHCNFASMPRRPGAPSDRLLDPGRLVRWLLDAGARRVTLCGGGEPLDEPEFCERTVRTASAAGLDFAIYTGGRSLSEPQAPAEYIRAWQRARGTDPAGQFWLRLSLDAFHADRIGTEVVAEWITRCRELVPDWKLTLRTLDVRGDRSLDEVAAHLGGSVRAPGRGSARLDLPDGRSLVVERMSFIVDGRASLDLLARRGLALPEEDAARLAPWQSLVGRTRQLGRALSRRLTVGSRHVDLEIHADAAVHVLESQPYDSRLSLYDWTWAEMRERYYRDPIIHAVAAGGLDLPAELLREAIERGIAGGSTVPFSVERIADARVLDWVSAVAVRRLADAYGYPAAAVELAERLLAEPAVGARIPETR